MDALGRRSTSSVKIRLLAVGKVRERYIAAAVADFRARLKHYESFEEIEVAASDGSTPERAMREEGERVLRLIEKGEPLWLLERTGDELSSTELCAKLEATARLGHERLTLAVAGTFGASPALLERADFRWSLSRLTLLHEWARALVLEQLYRAAKIARNEPYHH
jgi:23S rRNA (pseudouridine1915-N3)-methyltransferase